jgi:hypothetical protein
VAFNHKTSKNSKHQNMLMLQSIFIAKVNTQINVSSYCICFQALVILYLLNNFTKKNIIKDSVHFNLIFTFVKYIFFASNHGTEFVKWVFRIHSLLFVPSLANSDCQPPAIIM